MKYPTRRNVSLLIWTAAAALAGPALADGDPSGLSKYGKAIYGAIPGGYSLKKNDVISYNNSLPKDWLILTPQSDTATPGSWGDWDYDEGHSDSIPARVRALMAGADTWVDVTTLGGGDAPSGKFRAALIAALGDLDRKKKTITVRILLGEVTGGERETTKFVNAVQKAAMPYKNVKVYIARHRTSRMVWNHAKIVAVDGKMVMTGGHNMWRGYLGYPTYHDMSMVLEGDAAHQAHLFANLLWADVCDAGKSVEEAKVVSNAGTSCPAAYALKASAVTSKKKLPILALGRPSPSLASVVANAAGAKGLVQDNDAQFVAMMDAAESEIYISQKQLGPWLLSGESLGVAASNLKRKMIELVAEKKDGEYALGGWPAAEPLARAILRGVHVYVVIGDSGPMWTLEETARHISDRAVALYNKNRKGYAKVTGTIQDHVCKYLHVAPFTRGDPADVDDEARQENSGNHAKMVIVDKAAFYIGSQNLYYSPLSEFGLFVDDPGATGVLLGQYWDHLWPNAAKLAVSGEGAPQCFLTDVGVKVETAEETDAPKSVDDATASSVGKGNPAKGKKPKKSSK